jgi:hypothetical protein
MVLLLLVLLLILLWLSATASSVLSWCGEAGVRHRRPLTSRRSVRRCVHLLHHVRLLLAMAKQWVLQLERLLLLHQHVLVE